MAAGFPRESEGESKRVTKVGSHSLITKSQEGRRNSASDLCVGSALTDLPWFTVGGELHEAVNARGLG